MGDVLYLRPREKLRERGAKALSTVELLQIIIGSGNIKSSAARIAKKVNAILARDANFNQVDLLSIDGLGEVKVAQIIAAIELGVRYQDERALPLTPGLDISLLKNTPQRTVLYSTVDGSGRVIVQRKSAITDLGGVATVKTIFAHALHDSASAIEVALGSRREQTEPLDSALLSIVKMIYDTADLLEVRVQSLWVVNSQVAAAFKRSMLS